jgi:FAD/FMN-containing dehydrogenase
VTDAWAARAAGLVLAQCGVTIHELNRYLEHDKHRSLRTSGASNGQTVAGAMSADTHGSAIDQGPFGSQAVGLHLVTASEQLWIERASDPVVSTTLAARIGVQLIRDDAAFDAAVVGLGSLGVTHAVLIDTAPRFMLVESQRRVPYDATLQHAMDTLDFSALGFAERPYFFQVVLNPHAKAPEAYRKEMFLAPCPEEYVPNYALTDGRGAGYDVARLVGRFVDAFPGLTRAVARQLVKAELKEKGPSSGTWGETFDFTTPRAKSAGAALGVPLARCTEALALVREAFDAVGGAPMVFACRYVKRSRALLSLARFAPVTCVIDLDGVFATSTLAVMEGARERLERAGIPFTQHWGKLHGLTRERVRASHGVELETWLRVRHQLLPSAADRFTFSNPLLDRLGMSD